MRHRSPLMFCLFCLLFVSEVQAQENTAISKPELKLQGSSLLITYTISDVEANEEFIIGIEVRDGEGRKIRPKSLSGDIGEGIKGKGSKSIRWDLEADQVSMDLVLHVEVVGKRMNPPVAEVPEKIARTADAASGEVISISRWGALGRSAVFPGWGLSAVNPGKPHWIKGVAFYGSLAGMFALNRASYNSYQSYLDSTDPLERTDFYNRSIAQENASVVCMAVAMGVWVTDMVWTFAGTRNLSKKYRESVSISPSYNFETGVPLITMSIAINRP